MNRSFVIIGISWIIAAVAFAFWRIRSGVAESMPGWLKAVFVVAIGTFLSGVSLIARNAPASAGGGITQLLCVAAYILGTGAAFVLWHRELFEFIASPITSLYDGGSERVEPKPFYARARAHRMRGEHGEALEEVQFQLRQFPGDLEGWLLLAEIQSEDLHAPDAAIETLHTFLASDGISAEQRMLALQREADLLLFKLQDRAAAKIVLERLVEAFPNTEGARLASQRLSHMPEAEFLAESRSHERKRLAVVHHEESLGLTDDLGRSAMPVEPDQDAEIQKLVAVLVEHPDDWEHRERLAKLYAEHLDRPDLAHEQLERLVLTPGQPERQVVRWLNQIADIHVAEPDGLPAARLALERIGSRYPGSAAAEMAAQRVARLNLEHGGRKATPTLKLGTYSNRIGLEGQGPHRPLRARLPDLAPDPELEVPEGGNDTKPTA